jgi:thymidylate synthase
MPAFEALHYADRIRLVNPDGDVGVATLWAEVDAIGRIFTGLGIDLSPDTSRIAVLANLYGDGLPQMLRNLLWNPQIRHILVLGHDLSGSGVELENLLTLGAERVERYGEPKFLIRGTNRTIDTLVDPGELMGDIAVTRLAGKHTAPAVQAAVSAFFAGLPAPRPPTRVRREVPLPSFTPSYFPSEPRGHVVVRRTPLDAWEEVVFRLVRFGIPHALGRDRRRLELQNLKVVIGEPGDDRDEDLRAHGLSLERMRAYQARILDATLPDGLSYTYGNRMRGHFRRGHGTPEDLVAVVAGRLKAQPASRHAYLTLWDNRVDTLAAEGDSSPCLATLFFRVFEERLTLTATFRAHNTMSAWLENAYGLMAIQAYVAREAGVPAGAITVISHSISINPDDTEGMGRALAIARAKTSDRERDRASGKERMREDPHGYFAFTIDRERRLIVVHFKKDGELLHTYTGRTAQEIETQIARDEAISLISHALFVGRELYRHERLLQSAGNDTP